MNKRAAGMRAARRDAIALSLGESDFPTPAHIKAEGIAAIETDFTKYTATDGYGPLKYAISAKLEHDNGIILPEDRWLSAARQDRPARDAVATDDCRPDVEKNAFTALI